MTVLLWHDMNCNEIPEEVWVEAGQSLYFYFSRRFGFENAADLAQETMLRILSRPGYTFDDIGDFPKICIGFARHIAHEHRRTVAKWVTVNWEDELSDSAQFGTGPEAAEDAVLLREALDAAGTVLNEHERKLIQRAVERATEGASDKPMELAERVKLSRARQKLATYLNWKK